MEVDEHTQRNKRRMRRMQDLQRQLQDLHCSAKASQNTDLPPTCLVEQKPPNDIQKSTAATVPMTQPAINLLEGHEVRKGSASTQEPVAPVSHRMDSTAAALDPYKSLTATDISAMVRALHLDSDYSKPRDRRQEQENTSPSPSYTPPDQIDWTDPVTIVPTSVDPNPAVMCLSFGPSSEFILTHSEMVRGGNTNSFLDMWRKSEESSYGGLLKFNMPNDRDADLFRVLHDYLKGKEVIPLSSEHLDILLKRYSSVDKVYKRLYKEAKAYGIHGLMGKIQAERKHAGQPGPPLPEQFRVYDANTNCPLREEDLQKIAKRPVSGKTSSCDPIRVVVLGPAIK